MTSQTHDQLVDELCDEARWLRAQMTAVRAVVMHGEPDYRARCDAAASALRRLLELPGRRPGSWEAGPVTQLDAELRAILQKLTGGAS